MSDTVDPLAGRTMGEEVPLPVENTSGAEVPLPAGNYSGEEVAIPGYRPSGYQDGLETARQYGYGWAAIQDHLAQSTLAALDYGYSADEIDRHLGFNEPDIFEASARNDWAAQMAHDPAILEGLAAPDPRLNLTAIPTMRRSYADALLNDDVRGPQDFAYRWAAKALDAAHDLHGLEGDAAALTARKRAAVEAAKDLAPQLFTREDLADAVVGITRNDPAARQRARDALTDRWIRTGEPPLQLAIGGMETPSDPPPSLGERLRRNATEAFYSGTLLGSATLSNLKAIAEGREPEATITPEEAKSEIARIAEGHAVYERTPGFEGPVEAGAAFVGQLVGGMLSPESWLLRFPGFNWAVTQIAGTATTTVLSRILEAGFSQGLVNVATDPLAQQGVIATGIQEHYDPTRTALSFPLGFLAGGGLQGLGEAGRVAIARSIARQIDDLPEPTVSVVDLTKEPGAAVKEVPISEALRPPEPAAIEMPKPAAEGAAPEPATFSPLATPAEKLEKIAQLELENRGAAPNAMESGTFFQRRLAEEQAAKEGLTLADFPAFERALRETGDTDPAALALAKGHDAAASWGAYLRQVFGELLNDTSGAGPGIRPPEPIAELPIGSRAARIAGKNYADLLIRQIATGLGTQRSEFVAQGFERYFKDLAPFMPAWKAELAKPRGGDAMATELGKVVNAIEGKGVVDANNPMAPYVRYRVAQNEWVKSLIDQQVAAGNMNPVQYREFYLAHMYTPESRGLAGGPSGSGRTGNLGFTRQRTQPTYEDALNEGYKPLHDNPIIMDIASIDTKFKALATVEMQGIAKDQGWMRYYIDPAEARRDGFRPLTGLNSEKWVSTINPDGTPGQPFKQQLYGREGLDTIWNNWVGWESLQRNQKIASIEDAMLRLKNNATYIKLMFPGFHTITEFKNGMANGVANALTEMGFGLTRLNTQRGAEELGRGLYDLVKAPFKAVEYTYEAGTKWRPMYRAMEADRALDAFVGGGGAINTRSKVYAAHDSPTIWKLWSRGGLKQELLDDINRSFTFPKTRAEPSAGALARDFGNLATIPYTELSRGVTSLSAPVWDHFIPLLKSGAAIERLQTKIRQNPEIKTEALNAYSADVVTNIEDRMGEYNPANLFWNQAVKRAANQSMLSTSWTYGTIHATLTGIGYHPGRGWRWNPVATTNLMGQIATIAFTNAAWTYLLDGKLPDSTLDYLIPYANARAAVTMGARLMVPGEEKEYYDWMKIVAQTYSVYKDLGRQGASPLNQWGGAGAEFAASTFDYALGKVAPLYQYAKDLVTREDAIGHKIIWTPGGMTGWMENVFLPIFAQNWEKNERAGINQFETMMGMREAGKWFEHWDDWRIGQEKLHDRWSADELRRQNKDDGITPEKKGRGGRGGGGGRQRENKPTWGQGWYR